MRNTSSSSFSAFSAMEAAYLETLRDLAPQVTEYAMAAARAAAIEEANEEIVQPKFRDEERPRARRSQSKDKRNYRVWQH